MPQLSGVHGFRQFLRQLTIDFYKILYRTFPSHALIPTTLILEFYYMSNSLAWKCPVQTFKEIGSELTDKSRKACAPDNCVIDFK